MFEREELQAIRLKAMRMLGVVVNPPWVRAYERLYDAALALEAMQALFSVPEDGPALGGTPGGPNAADVADERAPDAAEVSGGPDKAV